MVFDKRQGDLYLFTTLDGGEISATLGEPVMDQGFETAVFLSLAGSESEAWWANEYLSKAQQIDSKFAAFAQANPLTSSTILTGEDLAGQDLAWMIDVGIADSVIVSMRAVKRNRVEVSITITIDGQDVLVSPFQINWGAQRDFPANERV